MQQQPQTVPQNDGTNRHETITVHDANINRFLRATDYKIDVRRLCVDAQRSQGSPLVLLDDGEGYPYLAIGLYPPAEQLDAHYHQNQENVFDGSSPGCARPWMNMGTVWANLREALAKKYRRCGIHKLFFNHPQSPISGTSTKAVKQLRTLFAAWAGGMAGAADVSTAVAGAESAAFWDGNMVAVAKVVMTNGWLRVYYGLKMVHENRIKSYYISMVIFIANCQLLWWFSVANSLFTEGARGCSIAGISLGTDSIFLLLVFWRASVLKFWPDGFMDWQRHWMLLEFNHPVSGVPKFDFHQSASS